MILAAFCAARKRGSLIELASSKQGSGSDFIWCQGSVRDRCLCLVFILVIYTKSPEKSMGIINSSPYLFVMCISDNQTVFVLYSFSFLQPFFHVFFRVCYISVTKSGCFLTKWRFNYHALRRFPVILGFQIVIFRQIGQSFTVLSHSRLIFPAFSCIMIVSEATERRFLWHTIRSASVPTCLS